MKQKCFPPYMVQRPTNSPTPSDHYILGGVFFLWLSFFTLKSRLHLSRLLTEPSHYVITSLVFILVHFSHDDSTRWCATKFLGCTSRVCCLMFFLGGNHGQLTNPICSDTFRRQKYFVCWFQVFITQRTGWPCWECEGEPPEKNGHRSEKKTKLKRHRIIWETLHFQDLQRI